jgi:pyruvate/2-oxoglutarate dehydrogenase complex dihydrolipoamide acyltransferase (E2) component
MKKLIAILLAAATLAAASVPAFAENEEVTPAEQNAVQQVEPVEEKEEKTEVETPAPAEEKAEETLPVEEAPVEQPAEQKATPDEQPETSEINSEEIKNFLASDEVKSALREAGLDEDEIEDVTENPESEIIYISQEEYEQMRRDYAKTAFSGAADVFLTGAKYILLIPATPIIFFIPFAGPLMCGVILASPIALIGGLGALIASPVVALVLYNSFKLEPPYELEK